MSVKPWNIRRSIYKRWTFCYLSRLLLHICRMRIKLHNQILTLHIIWSDALKKIQTSAHRLTQTLINFVGLLWTVGSKIVNDGGKPILILGVADMTSRRPAFKKWSLWIMKTSGWASGVSDPSAVKIFKHNVSPFTFTMTRRQFMLQKINNKQAFLRTESPMSGNLMIVIRMVCFMNIYCCNL